MELVSADWREKLSMTEIHKSQDKRSHKCKIFPTHRQNTRSPIQARDLLQSSVSFSENIFESLEFGSHSSLSDLMHEVGLAQVSHG
jgi:hypothetical protein